MKVDAPRGYRWLPDHWTGWVLEGAKSAITSAFIYVLFFAEADLSRWERLGATAVWGLWMYSLGVFDRHRAGVR